LKDKGEPKKESVPVEKMSKNKFKALAKRCADDYNCLPAKTDKCECKFSHPDDRQLLQKDGICLECGKEIVFKTDTPSELDIMAEHYGDVIQKQAEELAKMREALRKIGDRIGSPVMSYATKEIVMNEFDKIRNDISVIVVEALK